MRCRCDRQGYCAIFQIISVVSGIPQAGAGAEAFDQKTAQNLKFVRETFAKIGFEFLKGQHLPLILIRKGSVDTHRNKPCGTAKRFSWRTHVLFLSYYYVAGRPFRSTFVKDHVGGLRRNIPDIPLYSHGRNFLVAVSCSCLEELDCVIETFNCMPLPNTFAMVSWPHTYSWPYCAVLFCQLHLGSFLLLPRAFSLNQTTCVAYFSSISHIINQNVVWNRNTCIHIFFAKSIQWQNYPGVGRWNGRNEQSYSRGSHVPHNSKLHPQSADIGKATLESLWNTCNMSSKFQLLFAMFRCYCIHQYSS